MAVSRFDQPVQAQFANTYVPIPFSDITQAGLAKQQQYNQNLSAFDQAQAQAEQLKYIPGSIDEQYISGTVLPTFEELSEEYATKDFSDPSVIKSLNKRIRSLDRKRINRIQQSAQSYGEFQKRLNQMAAAGKTAPYLNQFDPKTFSSEFDIFNKVPEAREDFGAEAEKYFNQLRDTHLDFDPTTGQIASGVTPDIVVSVARNNLNEFMSSNAGRQAVQAMKYQGDTRSDSEIAYDVLLSRGMEFVRANMGFAPQHAISRPVDSQSSTSTSFGDARPMAGIPDKSRKIKKQTKKLEDLGDFRTTYKDMDTGEEVGFLKRVGHAYKKGIAKLDPTTEVDNIQKVFEPGTPRDAQIYQGIFNRTREYYGANVFDNKSKKEQLDLVDNYLIDYQQRAIHFSRQEINDKDAAKAFNNLFLGKDKKGNILAKGRKFYDPEKPIGEFIDYNTVADEYPPSEYNYYISHKLNPQNLSFPAGYTVTILDKKGVPVKEYDMAGSEEEQSENAFEHNLYKAMYANPSGVIDIKDSSLGLGLKGYMVNENSAKFSIYDGTIKVADFDVNNELGLQTSDVRNAMIDALTSYKSNVLK